MAPSLGGFGFYQKCPFKHSRVLKRNECSCAKLLQSQLQIERTSCFARVSLRATSDQIRCTCEVFRRPNGPFRNGTEDHVQWPLTWCQKRYAGFENTSFADYARQSLLYPRSRDGLSQAVMEKLAKHQNALGQPLPRLCFHCTSLQGVMVASCEVLVLGH